jgi:hypothetical protein
MTMPSDDDELLGGEDEDAAPIEVFGGAQVGHNIERLESLYERGTSKLRKGVNPSLVIRLLYQSCPWLQPADYATVRAWALLELQVSALYEVSASPAAIQQHQRSLNEIIKASTEIRAIRRAQTDLADRLFLTPKARKDNDLAGEGDDEEEDDLD